ncbi:MAG: hypothetical protein IJV15_05450 [Lachnospiraceae bacterium]|nr:hypothetical protein [Lachnospiraceae bacterium]
MGITGNFLVIRHDARLEYHKKELFALPSFNKALIMSVIISMSYVFVGMMVWHRGLFYP